jgi:hypothetical protein
MSIRLRLQPVSIARLFSVGGPEVSSKCITKLVVLYILGIRSTFVNNISEIAQKIPFFGIS